MRGIIIVIATAAALGLCVSAYAESASVMLEKGVYYEETKGDLDAAIAVYEAIVAGEEAGRRYAAEAQYRLGACYLKKGEREKATAAFNAVLSKYPDQAEMVEAAERQLGEMPPRGDWVPLGVVVERWLKDESEDLLDFETGEVVVRPDWAKRPDSILAWARESNVDFGAETNPSWLGGAGIDMAAVPVEDSGWAERLSVDQVNEFMRYVANSPLAPIGLGRIPATYVFRTREGTLGIMQMAYAEEDRLAVRYKLLAYGQEGAEPVTRRAIPKAAWVPLGEEVKIALGAEFSLVDFEGRGLVSVPRHVVEGTGGLIALAREKEADFGIERQNDEMEGGGFDLAAAHCEDWYWENGTLENVSEQVSWVANSPLSFVGRRGVPATYAFRTREGTVGLMRMEKTDGEGVELRYKLLGYGQEANRLPEGMVARATVPGDWVPLGVVIERVVSDVDKSKVNSALDLETGKLLRMPEGRDTELVEWALRGGVDFVADSGGNQVGGAGVAMVLTEVWGEEWDGDVTVNDLDRKRLPAHTEMDEYMEKLLSRLALLRAAGSSDGMGYEAEQWVEILFSEIESPTSMLPRTFAFRTKEGSVGLLQIVGGNEEEVRLRYKLLAYGEGTPTLAKTGVPGDWVALGEVVERVVNDNDVMKNMFLDFETGNLYSSPPDAGGWEQERLLKWLEETGIDVGGEDEFPGLFGSGLAAASLQDDMWDKATVEIVEKTGLPYGRTMAVIDDDGLLWTQLPIYPERMPTTYGFQTREGSVGVMQVLKLEDKQFYLRYKLLGYGEKTTTGEAGGKRRVGWLAINDVVVRTLESQGAMKECMLDLETGKVSRMPDPAEVGREGMSRILQEGVDLIGDISLKGAAGFNMAAVRVEDSVWDGATAERVNQLGLGTKANEEGTLLVGPTTVTVPTESGNQEVSGGTDFPVTYAFRTGEGTVGVLQILAAGDDRIHIRYKLLGYGGEPETYPRELVELAQELDMPIDELAKIWREGEIERETVKARSRRRACKNRLKTIGVAIHTYATDHDMKFPAGETAVEALGELVAHVAPGPYLKSFVFVCPADEAGMKAQKETEKLSEETCSYGWVPGLREDSPPDYIVAYDKSPEFHGGMRNVLWVDGHVETMTDMQFLERMTEQFERMGLETSGIQWEMQFRKASPLVFELRSMLKDEETGEPVGHVMVKRLVEGQWYPAYFNVRKGDAIGDIQEVVVKGPDGKAVRKKIDLRTGATVVGFEEFYDMGTSENKGETGTRVVKHWAMIYRYREGDVRKMGAKTGR